MGPPGGGRTFITPRLLRHLNLVSLVQFDADTMTRIYSTILKWFFSNRGFSADIQKLEGKVVASTVEVFRECCARLLPTPMKSHYLFNLRDFSKVILGICMSNKDTIQTQENLVRLWVH
jgi:dynein heavy chain